MARLVGDRERRGRGSEKRENTDELVRDFFRMAYLLFLDPLSMWLKFDS
jgi:hypothetical protein